MTGRAFVRMARRVRDHFGQRHRFAHTLGVARTADRLAAAHGYDRERARIAGLLHDLARLYPAERLLRECAERAMPIEPFERANPVVLHARLGAELARDWFGIEDEAILSAIRKHTVAAETMTRLDTILYLADALEPGRDFVERPGLLALAFRDLDGALGAVLASSLAYLRTRGLEASPHTLQAAAHLGAVPLLEKRPA